LQKYSKIIIGTHVFLPRSEVDDLRGLKTDLMTERKYSEDIIKMYRLTPSWIGVPLYHFRSVDNLAKKVIDKRTRGTDVKITFTKELRSAQATVVAQFKTLLASGGTGFLLQAPPGFGKTVTILKMLSSINKTTLVVVPRSNLVSQWVKRIRKFTGLSDKDIGIALERKCVYKGKKIVVGLVHSLALDRFGDDFKKYFGCIVFDEVDRSVPPTTFAPVVQMFPSYYRIGASATFKRQDETEVVFYKHIGQHLLRGKDEGRMAAQVLMYNFDGSSGRVWSGSSTINRRGMLLSKLAMNPLRNAVVRRFVELIVNSDRRVIVLSDRSEQLIALREALLSRSAENGLKSSDIGFYVRRLPVIPLHREKGAKTKYKEVSQKYRDTVARNCKVILATYGMIAIGTDIPDVAGMIYATPQTETEQSRGRIERFVDGKKQPVLVDIIDRFYPDAQRWATKREFEYREKGLKIKYVQGGV